MLKNFKSALSSSNIKVGGGGGGGGNVDSKDSDSKKRRKQKKKEAEANVQACINALKVTKCNQVAGGGCKSLGSKKLASVIGRLRLITSIKRKSHYSISASEPIVAQQINANSNIDIGIYGPECKDLKLLMIEQQQQQQQHQQQHDAYGSDTLSYYSAMDYFDDHNGSDETKVSVAGDFSELANDSKFVLPEEQCDIPTFLQTKNCDRQLIDETRRLLRERYQANPASFYERDYERMLNDDWTVTRFLLRRRLDPKRTAKLMEECGKFRIEHQMGSIKMNEFPCEFHKAGGLFCYKPDRVGNQTLYMRVKMYRRVPEISDVFKAWILCALEQCDVVSGGRGTAVIFDLSGCGLQNIDLGFLFWLLSSFRNYCPKGVSYIIVYNLPWFMSATCKLAMTWMSETNRRALRFVQGEEIENFIERDHLPDYLGGTCKLNYRRVPAGSKPATEVCDRLDMTPEQALKIKDLFKEYLKEDDDDDGENDEQDEQDQDDDDSGHGNKVAKNNNKDKDDSANDSLSQYGDARSLSDKHERISCKSLNSSRASTALVSEINMSGQPNKRHK